MTWNHNDQKRLLAKIALCLGLLLTVGSGFIANIQTAYADETTLPNDPDPLPIMPDPIGCQQIYEGLPRAAANPYGGSGPMYAGYIQCIQAYNGQIQAWREATIAHWNRRSLQIMQTWQWRIKVALLNGVLDAMGLVAQRIAYQTAQLVLTGGHSQEAMFWNQTPGEFLTQVGDDASSVFLTKMDTVMKQWTQENLGTSFGLCAAPGLPLTMKFALSIGRQGMIQPGSCTVGHMKDNFEAIGDMVNSGDAIKIQQPQFTPGPNNDLSAMLSINNIYIQNAINKQRDMGLSREEAKGMKQVTDIISGKIRYPSFMANEELAKLDPITMDLTVKNKQEGAMLQAYWETGLEGVGWITLSTFTNTLVVGILERIFKHDPEGASVNATQQQYEITFSALQNADAAGDSQDLYERQSFAKALGDYVTPNYRSTEDRDMVSALMVCTEPRTRWNCAMDQAMAVAITAGTKDGGITVGRAAGVGSEKAAYSPGGQGLHADWELVPENDIRTNSDPACSQRAYCAGNLKKLRLARIVTIGWEMAANSPYNLKREGKYITLGQVIRGFYDCNDKGELDKDHPWCHLVDPNWILIAPKYQCRAKGYGDALIPGIGTRLEECGDMVTCLSSDSTGQCTGGYGYCLAERSVYRFDAKECESQFASCRTWQSSKGETLSGLRYSIERGHCSTENIGCMWYATQRYATSTKSPDNLWAGTVTSGPRVYFDGSVKTCTGEGCTKMLRVNIGETALNLLQNGSFEDRQEATVSGVTTLTGLTGWVFAVPPTSCSNGYTALDSVLSDDGYDQAGSLALKNSGCSVPVNVMQAVPVATNRNYTLSMAVKAVTVASANKAIVKLYTKLKADGTPDPASQIVDKVAAYQDCTWDVADHQLIFNVNQASTTWQSQACQFVTPKGTVAASVSLIAGGNDILYDAVQLEEGEYSTAFVDGVADLEATYLKIAPEEYKCTGNDSEDNPACKRFARMCRQTEVGCQGYKDMEDPTAPEVPAMLSVKDLCPAICAGYGDYRKLPSSFDLVRDEVHHDYNDPNDDTVAYFVPGLAEKCSLADVGCEAFTSMEAATSTGEEVYHYNSLRMCQKPNEKTATYFTWEGSDVTGYQLRTWSLIASSTEFNDHGPKIVLRGATFGSNKDPGACNEITWKTGVDPDCLQFYDASSTAYYRYYSQTVSSDPACTLMRKNDSTYTDCVKTGGEYQAQTKSCFYLALKSESSSCSANAGGCRAYMGPTGRNASNVFSETFMSATSKDLFNVDANKMKPPELSKESVLVGDQSLKLSPIDTTKDPITATMNVPLPTTSTLYRISFWAKAATSTVEPASVNIDNNFTGTFKPDVRWKRFEFGPFYAKGGLANKAAPNTPTVCINFQLKTDGAYVTDVYTQNGSVWPYDKVQAVADANMGSYWNTPALNTQPASCSSDAVCAVDIKGPNNAKVGTAKGKCVFTSQVVALVTFSAPIKTGLLYLDTVRVDQLNDIQFVRKGAWTVPAACDATYPEGVPEPHAMVGCRAYNDRDGNTAFVRSFSDLCPADTIGCKAFVDTRGRPNTYPETRTYNGTQPPSKHSDGIAHKYDEQYLGSWSITSKPYRYYYAIDDSRAQCSSSDNMCRAFGQPVFTQDRLGLGEGTSTAPYGQGFKTVLMIDDWSQYQDENGEPKMACRKDELFCEQYKSGNITEYFRNPGNHACVWQPAKKIAADPENGIPVDGEYGGWFREGSDIPCYPEYLCKGDTLMLNYTS